MKRKVLATILALAMTCSLMACGSSGSDASQSGNGSGAAESGEAEGNAETASAGGPVELHVAQDMDPGSMAPYGTEGPRNVPCNMIYESLGNISPDKTEFYLVLAKSLEETEPNVYDIEIYDYITDSEGNPMTADDVIFSYDKYLETGLNLQYTASLESYEKTGDYSVRITMSDDAQVGALETMLEKVRIITQAAWEASADEMATTPVGTATYILTNYTTGQQLTFAKRTDYWQTDDSKRCIYQQSNADTIYLDIITDASTQAIAMQSGQLDISQFIPTADMVNFVDDSGAARDGYIAEYVLHSALFQIVYNCGENSPMSDINLRKAVAYAIDSQAVMTTGWGANGYAATTLASAYSADYDTALDNNEYFPYDPELAKEYLADSSYQGENIRILVTSNFPSDSAALVLSYLQAVGINAELLSYENAQYLALNADNTGTEYELEIEAPNSTGYICSNSYEYDKNHRENGLPHIMVDDPELQELFDTMAARDTNSKETATAFLNYIQENVYGYGLGYRMKCCIGVDRVQSIAFNEWGDLLPAACEVINK